MPPPRSALGVGYRHYTRAAHTVKAAPAGPLAMSSYVLIFRLPCWLARPSIWSVAETRVAPKICRNEHRRSLPTGFYREPRGILTIEDVPSFAFSSQITRAAEQQDKDRKIFHHPLLAVIASAARPLPHRPQLNCDTVRNPPRLHLASLCLDACTLDRDYQNVRFAPQRHAIKVRARNDQNAGKFFEPFHLSGLQKASKRLFACAYPTQNSRYCKITTSLPLRRVQCRTSGALLPSLLLQLPARRMRLRYRCSRDNWDAACCSVHRPPQTLSSPLSR